jgi:seryl-tRNA synthetase
MKLDRLLANLRSQSEELSKLRQRNLDDNDKLQETDALLNHIAKLNEQIDKALNHDNDRDDSEEESTLNYRDLPSSDRFAKQEMDLLRKLVEKSDTLRLPSVPGAEASNGQDVLSAASGSGKQQYIPLDRAMSKLLQRK